MVLHIGHAKSICLNFGLAKYFSDATCYLRFDDTNPSAEKQEYIDSIVEDVKWLGFSWDGDGINILLTILKIYISVLLIL